MDQSQRPNVPAGQQGTARTRSVASTKAAAPMVHAPSTDVPLRFAVTGMAALVLGVCWLALRPDILATYHYNQYVVAVTHLFTLGFVCSVIMGAMYQLVPVALETSLYSERLARWQFGFHVIGLAGMVWKFWVWDMTQVGHFATVFACGVGMFVYNVGRTIRRAPRFDLIALGLTSALGWLSLTVIAGLYLAAAKCWNFSPFGAMAQMHAHAHVGVIGFFVMMIVTVSYKLVPMFALSDVQNQRRARASIWLLNAGLAALATAILLQSPWKLGASWVVILGLVLYVLELRAIFTARKRRAVDWGLRYFFTAVAFLVPECVLAVVLCWPGLPATLVTTQLETVYGLLAILGVVGLSILGFSYKILPFLVWYRVYGDEVGKHKVPSLAQMYSARLQAVIYWLWLPGLAAVSISTALGSEAAVRASVGLLIAGLVLHMINAGMILSHLWSPRFDGSTQT